MIQRRHPEKWSHRRCEWCGEPLEAGSHPNKKHHEWCRKAIQLVKEAEQRDREERDNV